MKKILFYVGLLLLLSIFVLGKLIKSAPVSIIINIILLVVSIICFWFSFKK
jgi:hypothetical protein